MTPTHQKPSREQYDFLSTVIKDKWDGMLLSQTRLINWLFAVPGVGIAGTLGYAAKASSSPSLIGALMSFGWGLVAIILYGTVMYYRERKNVVGFKNDMDDFLAGGTTTWEEIFKKEAARPNEHKIGEWFAWLSALLSLSGMIWLAVTLLYK